MPPVNAPPTDIAHVIQLAIAPVFLLSSLGTILGVLAARLARIVDRTRALVDRREKAGGETQPRVEEELHVLMRRRGLVNAAIGAGVVAALLVSLLIAVAFLGSLVDVRTGGTLATLFVLAMCAYVAALVLFLREVLMASRSMHVEFR
jgi:uncharacterized membrane protein YGL010W